MEIITVNSINLATVAVAFLPSHCEATSIVMSNTQPKAYILSHKNYTIVAPKENLLFISMENTIDTKSTIALFDRENS
jgi:hypothetical protein